MKSVKWYLFHYHIITFFIELTLNNLIAPLVFLPSAAVYPNGLLIDLGFPFKLVMYIADISFIALSLSMLMIFENRQSQIVTIPYRMTRPSTKLIFYACHYMFFPVLPLFYYLDDFDQSAAKLEILEIIPCPEPHFFLERTQIVTVKMELSSTISSLMVLYYTIIILFYAIQSGYYLLKRPTSYTSDSMRLMQRKFFFILSIQIVVPIFFLFIPNAIYYGVSTADQFVSSMTVIFVSLHGMISSICLIVLHKPYRDFTWDQSIGRFHILSPFSVILGVYGIIVIVVATPKSMESAKWFILHLHVATFYIEVVINVMLMPFMFLPTGAIYSSGLLMQTGFSFKIGHIIGQEAFPEYGLAILMLYENRHSLITTIPYRITRKRSKVAFYTIHYLTAMIVLVIFYMEIVDNETEKLKTLQVISCPDVHFFDEKTKILSTNVSIVYICGGSEVLYFCGITGIFALQKAVLLHIIRTVNNPLGSFIHSTVDILCDNFKWNNRAIPQRTSSYHFLVSWDHIKYIFDPTSQTVSQLHVEQIDRKMDERFIVSKCGTKFQT
ncbi:hypothetical protein GCK72_019040 [Caenorhabditis remanei]|uniref:Serpentine Receptor, class H n=1 Tax=Caenorhabditis remanei TaxID=31234 RepID=A0A6A5GCX4_CAERE|nr:hypothetical protein GCK72_019040 [Caenorhabditis remanei]KAF1752485.1 hypothetical protein GCK72_019040 [Caenorhabditis remanei]